MAGALTLRHASAASDETVIAQTAPLSGVLASTGGAQMVLGDKVCFDA